MSAKHALLGLLLDRPGYPYELGDRLQRRLGPGWAVNPGQLYQTIERLARDGLIEPVADASQDEGRQVFAITAEGVDEFERWFDSLTGMARPSRRPLLVKVSLAGPSRLRRVLAQLDAYEADRANALATLAERRDSISLHEEPLRADYVLLHLNITAEIFAVEADLRWAERARETITWLLDSGVVWPSARERNDALREGDAMTGRAAFSPSTAPAREEAAG